LGIQHFGDEVFEQMLVVAGESRQHLLDLDLQSVAVGALRGMKDTRMPLLFAAISYWLVGFTSAYGLAFWTPLGAVGVWIGLSCGTAVYAVLLILRFRLLTRHLEFATSAEGGR